MDGLQAGIDVLIKAINACGIPGLLLNRQDEAHRTLHAVVAPNLKVQVRPVPLPVRHELDRGELPPPIEVIDKVAADWGW